MKTDQVESVNMAKNLSIMFDSIIPLSKESFRLTKEQKEKFKKIKTKTKEDQHIKRGFVFHSHQQRRFFHIPLISNPMQSVYENTFSNQKEFGKKIATEFENNLQLLTVLAIAPTQSGKTGSMISLLYECFQSHALNMHPENVFIFTSLSSREWVSQTQDRFPHAFKDQIYHRNQLNAFVEKVKSKTNILIIFDESHIANKANQSLHKLYKMLNLYNIQHLYDNNIKTVHFTATPEVLEHDLTKHWNHAGKVLHMNVPDSYVSIKQLQDQQRIFQMKDLCGYNPLTKAVLPIVYENIEEIRPHLGHVPKIHIIRTPRGFLHHIVIQNFEKVFKNVDADFISEPSLSNFDAFTEKPVLKHTFLFIKDKLRCAKTICHDNVGVFYDRAVIKPNHSSILQGLLGRMTGYHHNTHSVVFTSFIFLDTFQGHYSSFLSPLLF